MASIPTPAASVILFRRRPGLEMLMIERPVKASFGGLWAFPGGALEPIDSSIAAFGFADPWRAAALREMAEEVGIFLTDPRDARPEAGTGDVLDALTTARARFDPKRLRYLAAWITPERVGRRFDARFYTASVDPDTEGVLDTSELVDMAWVSPAEALRRTEDSDWHMALPTRWLVEELTGAEDPLQIPPHPVRMLAGLDGPFEIIDYGIPLEENESSGKEPST